jgi:hypothetical protein
MEGDAVNKCDYRIDGISYSDGREVCVVVGPDGLHIYRTQEYSDEDSDHTPPLMRALNEAKQWVAVHFPSDAPR